MLKLDTNISNKGFYVNVKAGETNNLDTDNVYIGVWSGYALICRGLKTEDTERTIFSFNPSSSYWLDWLNMDKTFSNNLQLQLNKEENQYVFVWSKCIWVQPTSLKDDLNNFFSFKKKN